VGRYVKEGGESGVVGLYDGGGGVRRVARVCFVFLVVEGSWGWVG